MMRGSCAIGTRPHSEAFRILRGTSTLKKHPHFRDILHAPRVVSVQLARELFSIFQMLFSLQAREHPRVLIVRCAYSENVQ